MTMQVWNPHHYQLRAMQLAVTRTDGAAAIFADPGLGKTSISYGVISILKEHGMFRRALVLAPRRPASSTWPKERSKWTQFKDFTIASALGEKADRQAALDAKTDILICHYDLLKSIKYKTKTGRIVESVGLVEMILAEYKRTGVFPFDLLILDESTKVKNSSTERYKALKQIAHLFERRILLTGTPAPNGLHDLYGQITIADGGKRLGTTLGKFRREYFTPEFIPGVPVPKWNPQATAEERIFAKIGDMALRLKAEDYIDMPERLFNTISVQAPADVMKTYRKVERDYIAGWKSGVIRASNAAASAMKLRQIASGTVYAEDENDARVVEYLHDAKAEALLDLIEEQNGQPLMVCVAFRSEVEYLRNVLAEAGHGDVPYIIGGVSDKRANELEDKWNRGEIPVLLVHPTTVSLGLNLQAGGNAVCWYSLTWNLEEFDQTNRRVWRQGQQAKTCVIHMIATEGTIDQRIADTLSSKDADQSRLFKALTDYVKEKENV
jgi:SNF2 family DNA or RNA helicase